MVESAVVFKTLYSFITFGVSGPGNFRIAGPGGAYDWGSGGHRFDPRQVRQHSFIEIDHEIFSMVIRSLPLIQEGQLSISGERMYTNTG